MWGQIRRWRDRFKMRQVDRPLSPPTKLELELADELKQTMKAWPPIQKPDASPSEAEWVGNLNRLRELILTEDPREFLRWDVIKKTMFVCSGPPITEELNFLKAHQEWESRWSCAIKESRAGHPLPYLPDPETSGNLIHHAYHLARFEDETAITACDIDFVVEFGGGYGSMCRLFHQVGFTGRYLIFDLPFFSALQKYYLKCLGIPVRSFAEFTSSSDGVFCISDMNELQASLRSDLAGKRTLFLATWSISETPVTLRNAILPMLLQIESFLIAYQHQFGEVDNGEYFSNWTQQFNGMVEWATVPITQLPGHYYLFGKRR